MRARVSPDAGERLRAAAERARDRLRAASRAGDRQARRLLQELGETPPPPRHYASDRDEDDDEASG